MFLLVFSLTDWHCIVWCHSAPICDCHGSFI